MEGRNEIFGKNGDVYPRSANIRRRVRGGRRIFYDGGAPVLALHHRSDLDGSGADAAAVEHAQADRDFGPGY